MTGIDLEPSDREMLSGQRGPAAALAMKIIVDMAGVMGAESLIDVSAAHIDGGLYHGQAGLDWARRLVEGGAQVAIPTTLNVGTLDLLHPDLYRGDSRVATEARSLMDAYVAMGCKPTWTCAPYQLPDRPEQGDNIAWAESNAIVFANSVLGARTNRYGDFIDICAAIAGRVPYSGLHRTAERRGRIVFDLRDIPSRLTDEDIFWPVLGHAIGMRAGARVPVVDGFSGPLDEDRMKALGAAAASSGSVALIHVVGTTPEAPDLDSALQGAEPDETIRVTSEIIASARDSLTTSTTGPLTAVSLGTPHFSVSEFARLTPLLQDMHAHPDVDLYVSTSRHVLADITARGWANVCERAGATLVVDTCTYITPILRRPHGVVMTNSAKWAYYAPGNLGVDVAFGSLEECVRSAAEGRITRDDGLWSHL